MINNLLLKCCLLVLYKVVRKIFFWNILLFKKKSYICASNYVNFCMEYLKTSIDFSELLQGRQLARCSTEESIAQHIMMIVTSHYGEVVSREDYGSAIWELEFHQLVRADVWEDEVSASLLATINKYEPRLKQVEVKVTLSEIEDYSHHSKVHIRRKADITVKGQLVTNQLPFYFTTAIYISPLSQQQA